MGNSSKKKYGTPYYSEVTVRKLGFKRDEFVEFLIDHFETDVAEAFELWEDLTK